MTYPLWPWNRWKAPWCLQPAPVVLFKADFGGGKELYLCDFATAGMAGTEYITWIPAAGTENLTQAEQPDRWLSVLPQA